MKDNALGSLAPLTAIVGERFACHTREEGRVAEGNGYVHSREGYNFHALSLIPRKNSIRSFIVSTLQTRNRPREDEYSQTLCRG